MSFLDQLSNRELQILHLTGKGMSTREIALALNLSIKTVESHRQRIKGKLNLDTGRQLLQYAVMWFQGLEANTRMAARDRSRPKDGTVSD